MKLASVRGDLKDAWVRSMELAMPTRHIRRGLVEPTTLKVAELKAGVLCLVGQGGGAFANYQGREGELGTVRCSVVGFVTVGERDPKEYVEYAEDALLEEVLAWCGDRKDPPLDSIYPGDYVQSGGLEHPIGWFQLQLEARHV